MILEIAPVREFPKWEGPLIIAMMGDAIIRERGANEVRTRELSCLAPYRLKFDVAGTREELVNIKYGLALENQTAI